MIMYRPGDQPAVLAPEAGFTGDVGIEGYFRREPPSRLAGATVTFPPGSRTPWKTNPAGQTIIVTAGTGRAQIDDEPVRELRAGDTWWCPPGSRHWEGAAPGEAMTYVALQEHLSERHGPDVEFFEAVTDDQYQRLDDA